MRQQIGESKEIKGPMSDRATQMNMEAGKTKKKAKLKSKSRVMHQIHSIHSRGRKHSSGCGRSYYKPKSIGQSVIGNALVDKVGIVLFFHRPSIFPPKDEKGRLVAFDSTRSKAEAKKANVTLGRGNSPFYPCHPAPYMPSSLPSKLPSLSLFRVPGLWILSMHDGLICHYNGFHRELCLVFPSRYRLTHPS